MDTALLELTDAAGRKVYEPEFDQGALFAALGGSIHEPPQGHDALLDPTAVPMRATGKRPALNDSRTLRFARFIDVAKVPKRYNPWKTRAPFMPRTFGNTNYGCCTRASQALHQLRFERIETKATDTVTDPEVLRCYFDMTGRRYGGGDTGAYELDALTEWRNPATTFRNSKGKPLTIAAFTRVDHTNVDEIKAAIALSGKWGIKLCWALPRIWSPINPPDDWDLSRDDQGKPAPLTGDAEPYTWGGHSTYAHAYDERGVILTHTWYDGRGVPKPDWPLDTQRVTWDALRYCDEAYWAMDDPDAWRQKSLDARVQKMRANIDVEGILKAVNKISRTRVNPKTGKVTRAA